MKNNFFFQSVTQAYSEKEKSECFQWDLNLVWLSNHRFNSCWDHLGFFFFLRNWVNILHLFYFRVEFVLVCCFTVDFVLLVTSRFLGEVSLNHVTESGITLLHSVLNRHLEFFILLSPQYIPLVFRSFRLALILCKVKNIQHIFNVSIL